MISNLHVYETELQDQLQQYKKASEGGNMVLAMAILQQNIFPLLYKYRVALWTKGNSHPKTVYLYEHKDSTRVAAYLQNSSKLDF